MATMSPVMNSMFPIMNSMFPMVSPMSNLAMMHYMNNPMVANTNPMLPYMMMPQQPSYSNPNMNQ